MDRNEIYTGKARLVNRGNGIYCWDAALKNGCKVHYPSGSASATVKKV